jgi:phosphate transport system permease protein
MARVKESSLPESRGRALRVQDLQGSKGRRRREEIIRLLLLGSAVISIVISALIVLSLTGKAITFLTTIDLGQLWTSGWVPRSRMFDIKTIVVGTLLVSRIAMLVAAPLGLGAAVFLSEYANPRLRRIVKPVLEILAGIPSVVLGFFALVFIGPHIVSSVCSGTLFFSIASAGLAVGILVTPLVASVAEDAMRVVPGHLREAAYGLGASRRTTTLNVVVPAAVSGIVASLILGLSRALGETMIVAIAAGASGQSLFTLNVCEPGQTMTAAMAALAIGGDQVAQAGAFESLFFVGLLLFVMTFALNVVSERFVKRVRERY